jgi:hypothetical protein
VLAVCDSSQTATSLAASTSLDVWQHATGSTILGKRGLKFTPEGGSYCILINGAVDADLTITKASWTSLTAASATMNDRGTSIALEGQISISEPKGVVFLNNVVQCCMELGVDSANAFWVLKTFFIGYTFDGTQDEDNADFIGDIPPIIFVAYDVSGNFNLTGGEYEISFLAAANSAARLPQYSKSAVAANIAPSGNLSDTLTALQNAVQKNYNQYYDCVYAQTKLNSSTSYVADKLRQVEYIITCDPPYKDNPYYTVTDSAAQLKNFGPACASGGVTVPPGMSIDDAIHKIIDMCKEIKDEAAVGVNGKKYIAKIHNWLESYRVTDDPKHPGETILKFKVGYALQRQEQPTSVSFDQASDGSVSAPNLITFDYLYTGKNVDILELDIKMNMGMVYLQGATIQNQYKQPGQENATIASSINGDGIRRANGQNIPVFFGTQIKSANVRDTKDINNTIQHAYSMTKHASLEALETTIKITGNTQLLGSINRTTDPEFIKARVFQPAKDDGYARFSEWSMSPSFIKVNIKMPRNNNDEALFTGSQTSEDSDNSSNDYAVDFWFQGYYYVYGIDHVFDNGEFFQTLNTIAIPEKGTFSTTDTQSTSNDSIDVDKLAEACFENKIGCGSVSATGGASSQSKVVFPEDHTSTSTPYAKVKALSFTPDKNLSNIAGYDKASPEVKQAIHNAAINNFGGTAITEHDLALMISYESSFRPGVVNRFGYKGLGQFGDSTWSRFGSGNPLDPNANADATAKYMLYNRKI